MPELYVRDDVRNFLQMLEQMGGKAAHEGTPAEARQACRMAVGGPRELHEGGACQVPSVCMGAFAHARKHNFATNFEKN